VFDEFNNSEQQSTQVSISTYLWERIALELSYTTGLAVQKDKQPNLLGATLRTTTSYVDAYGADLILVFADRNSQFQPFIKGGIAQVRRKVVIQDDGNNPWEIVYSGAAPGYGVGCKIFLTERFSIKASYDFLETPSNSDTRYSETTGRIGLSWVL
jgi:opacity protein-like surface antigen